MKKVYITFITIIYLLLMSIYWQTLSADESYKDGQRIMKQGNFEVALEQANKSISKNPREPRYYYGRAKILLAATSEQEQKIISEYKVDAAKDLIRAKALNPNNLVTHRNIIPLYYFLGIADLQQPSAVDNTDEDFIEIVKGYYQSIKHFSTNDVGIYTLLAKYESKLGLEKELNESLDNIRRLRPDLLEWYLTQ